MPSLAPERCKGLVRRELGFVPFLLLWLFYWNLFNKGYIQKRINSNQTPGRSGSWWFLHFPSACDYLIFFTSSTGPFLEVPLRSEPLIGSRFFVLLDILANLTFTQKKGGNNERKKSKEGTREGEQRGLSSDVFAEKFWPSGVSTEIPVHCCASDLPPPTRRFLRGLDERKKRG